MYVPQLPGPPISTTEPVFLQQANDEVNYTILLSIPSKKNLKTSSNSNFNILSNPLFSLDLITMLLGSLRAQVQLPSRHGFNTGRKTAERRSMSI